MPDGEFFRKVTFTFNMAAAFNSEEEAKYFKHEELFSPLSDDNVSTGTTNFNQWKTAFSTANSFLPQKISKSISNTSLPGVSAINIDTLLRKNTAKDYSNLGVNLFEKIAPFVAWKQSTFNFESSTPKKITSEPVDYAVNPQLKNTTNTLFLNNNQILNNINEPNKTLLTSTPLLEDREEDKIIKTNLNNALNDLAKSEQIILPSKTLERNSVIQNLSNTQINNTNTNKQEVNNSSITNLYTNNNGGKNNPVKAISNQIINNTNTNTNTNKQEANNSSITDLYTNNNGGKNNPVKAISNQIINNTNTNTTSTSYISEIVDNTSISDIISKSFENNNFKVTSTEYNLIKPYVKKYNTTTSKVISDLRTLTGLKRIELLNNIITSNIGYIQKQNNIKQTSYINPLNSINIDKSVDKTINDIKQTSYINPLNSINIDKSVDKTINENQYKTNQFNDSNMSVVIFNVLDEILKKQRTTVYDINDYKKQLQTALTLLQQYQSSKNNSNISLQLSKALGFINRKQAKKLTNEELQLFVEKTIEFYN